MQRENLEDKDSFFTIDNSPKEIGGGSIFGKRFDEPSRDNSRVEHLSTFDYPIIRRTVFPTDPLKGYDLSLDPSLTRFPTPSLAAGVEEVRRLIKIENDRRLEEEIRRREAVREAVLRLEEEARVREQELLFSLPPTAVDLKRNGLSLVTEIAVDLFSSEKQDESVKLKPEERKKLERFFRDKGFNPAAIAFLANGGQLGVLFTGLVLRYDSSSDLPDAINAAFESRKSYARETQPRYRGTENQNGQIDESIATSIHKQGARRRVSKNGATRLFESSDIYNVIKYTDIYYTPIVVIGGGPGGELTVRALVDLGFDPGSITVIDKTGQYGGIWNQKNVNGGSKNNPFPITYNGITVDAAPGPGITISRFLERLREHGYGSDLPDVTKGKVTKVKPGSLNHAVFYTEDGIEKEISAPIVINAVGNGKPLPVNREGHMTTPVKDSQAGIRWQQILTPEQAERFRGQMLVFIGLGNSTAEMMQQVEVLNSRGYDIDYRVLTHYPVDAIVSPNETVRRNSRNYRVFRDIQTPDLTKYEGDLPENREIYEKASRKGKILPDITSWDIQDGKLIANSKGMTYKIDHVQLYTLIGYGQDPQDLRNMGMRVTDEYLGTIAYDYDGEVQRSPGKTGRERVYPGYFGIGALLKSPQNPNAVVIPGIQHRLYDLLFGVTVRAAEYKLKQDGARN